jgi:hypothetical protein
MSLPDFAASLRPEENSPLELIRNADQWARAKHHALSTELLQKNPAPRYMMAHANYVEHRLVIGESWEFDPPSAKLARLQALFLADGWASACAAYLEQTGVVVMRLFALLEPVDVLTADGEAFPLRLPGAKGREPLPNFDVEQLIRDTATHGGWRYSHDGREFIPPHRIAGFKHRYATNPDSAPPVPRR